MGAGGGSLLSLYLYISFAKSALLKRENGKLHERKDQFVALCSHYLLTPISIIQVSVSKLQENEGSLTLEERSKLYEAIVRGQQRLWILAEQFLVVGEIDQGELRLMQSVADLAEVVTSAITAVHPFSMEKNLNVYFQEDQQKIWETRIDPRRMKQALIAILDNAIKFSPEGGMVAVGISLESDVFTITIKDQGIGMPDEILANISDKFYRGNQIYNFDYEGMGLGLHIAKAIVALHGGNIVFKSKPKEGTTVEIQFPNT